MLRRADATVLGLRHQLLQYCKLYSVSSCSAASTSFIRLLSLQASSISSLTYSTFDSSTVMEVEYQPSSKTSNSDSDRTRHYRQFRLQQARHALAAQHQLPSCYLKVLSKIEAHSDDKYSSYSMFHCQHPALSLRECHSILLSLA
ncbi:hypothetical protein CROQUDRAFT_390889 [Cronartium quercuum f. sp. fusiforme G11]|uniref:Uncharacterized protein n=1 Tax=Cronartium quercuum f. sp. fusiforme G11 TaxID=708437 RepID=A0A9P6TEB1_9BASI|nr:hypothetical protein CROQUDRAFT_390889 [Cronartium quercuum f. sp. fusiforme G11]